MFSTLSTSQSLLRLTRVLPPYFLLRALMLLGLGMGCLGLLFFHLSSQDNADTARLFLSLYSVSLLFANLYLIVWFPLREAENLQATPGHPLLLGLVVLTLLLALGVLRSASATGADLYLMAFTLILPACSAAGLVWWQALLLLTLASVAAVPLFNTHTGIGFGVAVLISQWVTLILFKSMIEEFRNRQILDLNLAELKATQHLLEQSVTQSTRQAIARDLHDELGHLVTRLHHTLQQLNASAAQQQEWQQANSIVRELNQQVRNIALQLRQPAAFDLTSTLQLLAQSIPHPQVELQLESLPATCPAQQGEVLFRICQEAITNCLRHANASRIQMSLALRDQQYCIRIRDNGTPVADITPGSGLTGLQERVQLLGGTLTFAGDANGFALTAHLPVTVNEHFDSID